MLLTAFLIFLVFSTYSNTLIINRLGTITIFFTLILYLNSINFVSMSSGLGLYNDFFHFSLDIIPMHILIFITTISLLIYTTSFHKYDQGSPFLMLFVFANLLGLLLLPMSYDLLAFYLVVELQSYSLYLLTGLYNKSFNASRASLIYFLVGGIASVTILSACTEIQDIVGSTNIHDILICLQYQDFKYIFDILLIALCLKMGMAPLHK